MAINKSNSPTWVKVTLIILIIAFVMSFVVLASNPFQAFKTDQTGTGQSADPIAAVNNKYQPQVAAFTNVLQSQPESYTILVSLGNTYFDWAGELQSQNSTQAQGAAAPLLNSAKDAYARALKIKATESPVQVDYAITLFYTGDTLTAVKTVEGVEKADPKFAPAPFNLGIFYGALGENAKAIAAFNRYLELDPKGEKGGNPQYAKQQLEALKKLPATTATTTP